MIKIIYCITRASHLTREEFQHYWLNSHGPSVRDRAKLIGMVKYAQSHTIASALGEAYAQSRGGAEPYDGVMEGWWESEEAAMSAMGSDGGREAMAFLLADESKFMDFSKCRIFTSREFVWEPAASQADVINVPS